MENIIIHGFENRSAADGIIADISVSTTDDLPTVEQLESLIPGSTIVCAFALIRQTGLFYILDVPDGGDWYASDGSGQPAGD